MNQEVLIHNKFDITIEDVLTGEKQSLTTYNIILDSFFNGFSLGYNSFRTIVIGTGTGTLSVTRTTPFNPLANLTTTTLKSYSLAYPSSYKVLEAKLETTDYNGSVITEVGISDYPYDLKIVTHALLKDNEGNPISITKTDTMVVYIQATVYCTITNSGLGDNGIYALPSEAYSLPKLILGLADANFKTLYMVSGYDQELESVGDISNFAYASVSIGGFTYNYANNILTITIPVTTFNSATGNNGLVRYLGIRGIGAIKFPDTSVMASYAVTDIVIGSGDGSTTDFNIKCPKIVENSEVIKVDGVTKVRGVDYTIEYENNCIDAYSLYHSTSLRTRNKAGVADPRVSFGVASGSPGYYVGDPLLYARSSVYSSYTTVLYPISATITDANPIKIDFSTSKKCNRLKITMSLTTAIKNAMKIQYSNDNITFTDVTNLSLNGQNWSFDAVSARYWKIWSNGQTWVYDYAQEYTIENGVRVTCTFFLGYTTPGLKFTTPPAQNSVITASYNLDRPFKTSNNLVRLGITLQLQRG